METSDEAHTAGQLHPDLSSYEALAADDTRDSLHLSEKEHLILQLYDRIHELQIEEGVLQAQNAPPDTQEIGDNIEEQVKVAEKQLLEARATYSIRKKVEESVMTASPTLKAVHATHDATIPERLLFPLLTRRDVSSLVHENIAKRVSIMEESLSRAEVDNMKVTRKNQELVQVLLDLTEKAKTQRDDIDDKELKNRLGALERENKARRARWRTMKDVLGSVIVGSGVNWAQDEELCSLVMDEE